MWRFRLIYLLCLAGAVIFHLAYGEELSKYLLVLVVFLPVLSLIISLPSMLMARLNMSAPQRCTMGDGARVELGIKNKLPAGLVRVKVCFENEFTCEQHNKDTVFFFGAFEQSRLIDLPTENCGRLRLHIISAYATDYMGIFALPIKRCPNSYCTVLPRPVKNEALQEQIARLPHRLVPKSGGGYSEEHELRPYRQGDSMTSIHWKLSSKLDDIIVREPMVTEQQRMSVTIMLKGSPKELNSVLNQLVHLSVSLIEKGQRHIVLNPYASTKNLRSYSVQSAEQLNDYFALLLQSPAAKDNAKPVFLRTFRASRSFVIRPQKEADDED